jgi:hypothetical protein
MAEMAPSTEVLRWYLVIRYFAKALTFTIPLARSLRIEMSLDKISQTSLLIFVITPKYVSNSYKCFAKPSYFALEDDHPIKNGNYII